MWLLIAFHSIFATTYTLGKASLNYSQPLFYIGSRMLASGFLMFCYALARKQFRFSRADIPILAQLTFFQIYLAYLLMFSALKHVDSTKWALIFNLTPFFVAFFSYFYFNEKITGKKVIGFLIAFFGLIPALIAPNGSYYLFYGISFAELIILLSVISYAFGWIAVRRLVARSYASSAINSVAMLMGGIGLLATSYCTESWSPSPVSELIPFATLFLVVVIATIFTFGVNTYLLKWYTATLLSFVGFIDPLYVAFYGWLFLNETIHWYFFVSLAAVCIGLYIFYKEEIAQGYVAP